MDYREEATQELYPNKSYGELTDKERKRVDDLYEAYIKRNKDGGELSDLGKLFKKAKNVLGLKEGGMVNKRKKKIKMAGRIAKRGYGKARK